MSATTRGQLAAPAAFLIWSNEHRSWWAPNAHGYVQSRAAAGRYTLAKAIEVCLNANIARRDHESPKEAIVPLNRDEIAEDWSLSKMLNIKEAVVHGVNCPKEPHIGTGHLHAEDDDRPYDIDECWYCGRCHVCLPRPGMIL